MLQKLIATLFAVLLAAAAGTARAQDVVLTLVCDLGGAPAEMTMGVQYQQASGISTNPRGDISGIFPVGVTVYTFGEVASASARYTFRGENQYADFTTAGSYERFRVQWQLDHQRNGIWMIVNPLGDARSHFCGLRSVR